MPRRSLTAPALALLLMAGTAAAHAGEAHLYVAPYLFNSELTGDGRLSGGSTGTDFDLEDTLGIDPDEKVRGLDAFVKFFGNRIEFSYASGEYDGDETLTTDLVFNGITFSTSEDIVTEIDYSRYKLMYGFDFGLKIVNAGFLVGAHLIDIEATVKSQSTGTEREDLRVPIPVVGATLGIHPISKLAIHAEVSGMSLTVSDVEATLIDGFVGVDYLFLTRFGITGGYRYFRFEATDEDDDDHIDLVQQGPYVGLVLHL